MTYTHQCISIRKFVHNRFESFSEKEEFSTPTRMTKSRAVMLKSYRGMPIENRNVRNLDPRKMQKGFLVSKISAYRYQIRKAEKEAKELKASIISQKLNRTETNMMNDLLNQKEQRLMRMNKYLCALEARKDGAF